MPLGECDFAVRDGGERTADFSGVSELWREDSAEGFVELAEVVCDWRMAWRSVAVAPNVHVDLPCDRGHLSGVPDFQRQLSAGLVFPPRHSRRVAGGESLFSFWCPTSTPRTP